MRAIYISASGQAIAEKVGLRYDNVQEPDGIHPMSEMAVYKDINRTEAIVLIQAGTAPMIGESRKLERYQDFMFRALKMMVSRRSHWVSRGWKRKLNGGMWSGIRLFYFLWFVMIIVLAAHIPIMAVG